MSKPTTWRLPLAALSLVGMLWLTLAPLAAAAVDVDQERHDATDSVAPATRCGDRS